MGLHNHFSDVASESILVIVLVLIARCAIYLRSLVLDNLRAFRHAIDPDRRRTRASPCDAVRSGLARIAGLCKRLTQNRAGSHRYRPESGEDRDCVVCLDRLREGDEVRTLACRHVFHRACLDSWLDQLNLICPLCRAPVEPDECVEKKRRRVEGDSLLEWFQATP